jgi:SAM-dependent methyltransferase
MLAWAARERPGAKILDFGSGEGQVVAAGCDRGWDMYGAEVFAGDPRARQEVVRRGLLGDRVREIREGRLPFADGFFDLALSNTVFEHVVDLEGALSELHRVLRAGGRLVAFFPTREVVREGHFGLLFVHWLRKGSALRDAWVRFSRSLGFGRHKEGRTREEWIRYALDWMDRFTFYRPLSEVVPAFRRWFRITFLEEDYLSFRLEDRSGLGPLGSLLRIPWVGPPARECCRRWGGVILLATKPGGKVISSEGPPERRASGVRPS